LGSRIGLEGHKPLDSGASISEYYEGGRIAQLGEHRPYKPGVTGSSPVPPTRFWLKVQGSQFKVWFQSSCTINCELSTLNFELSYTGA
jgi:hypothetical protein